MDRARRAAAQASEQAASHADTVRKTKLELELLKTSTADAVEAANRAIDDARADCLRRREQTREAEARAKIAEDKVAVLTGKLERVQLETKVGTESLQSTNTLLKKQCDTLSKDVQRERGEVDRLKERVYQLATHAGAHGALANRSPARHGPPSATPTSTTGALAVTAAVATGPTLAAPAVIPGITPARFLSSPPPATALNAHTGQRLNSFAVDPSQQGAVLWDSAHAHVAGNLVGWHRAQSGGTPAGVRAASLPPAAGLPQDSAGVVSHTSQPERGPPVQAVPQAVQAWGVGGLPPTPYAGFATPSLVPGSHGKEFSDMQHQALRVQAALDVARQAVRGALLAPNAAASATRRPHTRRRRSRPPGVRGARSSRRHSSHRRRARHGGPSSDREADAHGRRSTRTAANHHQHREVKPGPQRGDRPLAVERTANGDLVATCRRQHCLSRFNVNDNGRANDCGFHPVAPAVSFDGDYYPCCGVLVRPGAPNVYCQFRPHLA